jgi:hypothetical protein
METGYDFGNYTFTLSDSSGKSASAYFALVQQSTCEDECKKLGYNYGFCGACGSDFRDIGINNCPQPVYGTKEGVPSCSKDVVGCVIPIHHCCCSYKKQCPYECCENDLNYLDKSCSEVASCSCACPIGVYPCPPCACPPPIKYVCTDHRCVPETFKQTITFYSGWNMFSNPVNTPIATSEFFKQITPYSFTTVTITPVSGRAAYNELNPTQVYAYNLNGLEIAADAAGSVVDLNTNNRYNKAYILFNYSTGSTFPVMLGFWDSTSQKVLVNPSRSESLNAGQTIIFGLGLKYGTGTTTYLYAEAASSAESYIHSFTLGDITVKFYNKTPTWSAIAAPEFRLGKTDSAESDEISAAIGGVTTNVGTSLNDVVTDAGLILQNPAAYSVANVVVVKIPSSTTTTIPPVETSSEQVPSIVPMRTCTFDSIAGKVWHYSNGKYEEASLLNPGEGYWVKMKTQYYCFVQIEGKPVVISDFPTLTAGWNQIGSPSQSVQFSTAIGNCKVAGGPWKYNTAAKQYEKSDYLKPGEGYWVNVESQCKLGESETPPLPPVLGSIIGKILGQMVKIGG